MREHMALSAEDIDRIEIETFDSDKWEEGHGDPECLICLSEYENGEKLRVLKCKHRFHVACVDQWLERNGVCPICKVDLHKSSDTRPAASSHRSSSNPRPSAGVPDDSDDSETEGSTARVTPAP